MKRSEFFNYINSLNKDQIFKMTYLKKNGEVRNATCKLNDIIADEGVKGTGINRHEKMNRLQVFQYFDVNSNAYRSARLENIQSVIVEDKCISFED